MNIVGDYHGAGYAHLKGLIPRALAQEFLAQLRLDIDRHKIPLKALVRPAGILPKPTIDIDCRQNRQLETFLWGLTPTMAALTGRELLPTYSYFRVYQKGDLCLVHSDREACEHSLSLTLGYSDEETWPLELGNEWVTGNEAIASTFGDHPFTPIAMQPGDAVLYQGVHYRHGRTQPNPNRWSAHLFLHWVDSTGPHASEAFVGRPAQAAVDFTLS